MIFSPRGLPGCSRSCFSHLGTSSYPQLPKFSDGTLRTIHLASRPACSFHADDQTSLKFAKLWEMSSDTPSWHSSLSKVYNRHVVVTFINLPLKASLYGYLFLIAAPLQGVRLCAFSPNLDHLRITYSSSYLQSFAIVFSFLLGALFSMSLSVY